MFQASFPPQLQGLIQQRGPGFGHSLLLPSSRILPISICCSPKQPCPVPSPPLQAYPHLSAKPFCRAGSQGTRTSLQGCFKEVYDFM